MYGLLVTNVDGLVGSRPAEALAYAEYEAPDFVSDKLFQLLAFAGSLRGGFPCVGR